MKTRRIYYGPEGHECDNWWTVKVSPAKRPVTINGSIVHALKAYAGVTVGCGLSNMAIDKTNKNAFGFPVFLASFTKTKAFIVDRLKRNGEPAHAVEYDHSYGHITDRNDDKTLKKLVREDPALIERPFTLRVPRNQKGRQFGATSGKRTGKGHGRAFVPRGALARAVKAGRIGKNVAVHLMRVAKEQESEAGAA